MVIRPSDYYFDDQSNEMQISEREASSRNRNRPTDWWAAAPSPAVPQPARVQITPKKPAQALSLGQNSGNVNSFTARNGTKSVKGKRRSSKLQDVENNEENDQAVQSGRDGAQAAGTLRKGRSSDIGAQFRAALSYKEAKTRRPASSKDAKPEIRARGESSSKADSSVKRGRPSNTEAEPQTAVNHVRREDLKRRALTEAINHVQPVSGTRRGRSFNVEAEQQKHVNYKEGKNYKRHQATNSGTHVQAGVSPLPKNKPNSKTTFKVSSAANPKVSTSLLGVAKSTGITNSQSSMPGKVSNPQQPAVDARQGSSQPQPQRRKRKQIEAAPQSPSSKRRRFDNLSQREHLDVHPRNARPAYQQLAPVTRRISRTTIDAKWDALPQPCAERISQLLQDIQRPVVVRLTDERWRNQASSAIQMISRKLVRKISKGLPFPPGAHGHREDDFNFEKILDHSRALELQLTPVLHANELLEAEIEKEKLLLAIEEAQLVGLKTNAKAEAARRKQDQRKLHSLLRPGDPSDADFEDRHGFKLLSDSPEPLNLSLRDDEELQHVVRDLEGHMESIDVNLKQVKGITQAIVNSKAALQAALFQNLDSTQYYDAVLG